MKLIDLLVQELPKRGGWPDCVDSIHQDHDGEIYAWTGSSCKLLFRVGIIADNCRPYGLDESIENMVTRNQYKSALALLQKPAWNGEGLPPVGCECEISFYGKSLGQCEVLFVGDSLIVWKQKSSQQEVSGHHGHMNFRPLRTESERKRDAFINAVLDDMRVIPCDLSLRDEVAVIYDAIAAGKIPGVRLDD